MKLVANMLSELLGLFVDDGSLVLAVIGWVATVVVCLRAQWLDPALASVLLALGIGILLVENVLRFTRSNGLSRSGKK